MIPMDSDLIQIHSNLRSLERKSAISEELEVVLTQVLKDFKSETMEKLILGPEHVLALMFQVEFLLSSVLWSLSEAEILE